MNYRRHEKDDYQCRQSDKLRHLRSTECEVKNGIKTVIEYSIV